MWGALPTSGWREIQHAGGEGAGGRPPRSPHGTTAAGALPRGRGAGAPLPPLDVASGPPAGGMAIH
uniref:Uncharacterized protein n=1 Tax=Streptomyces kanamyceticus TaxID=1967 RepID=Q1EQN3_STRKN|nr:hypothetical protein [Streptomyces kanamyceticus]